MRAFAVLKEKFYRFENVLSEFPSYGFSLRNFPLRGLPLSDLLLRGLPLSDLLLRGLPLGNLLLRGLPLSDFLLRGLPLGYLSLRRSFAFDSALLPCWCFSLDCYFPFSSRPCCYLLLGRGFLPNGHA